MTVKQLVKYLGRREDEFGVIGKVTGHMYTIKIPGILLEVDLRDWPGFPKKFFEAVQAVQPETIDVQAGPLEEIAVINPSDGISDKEAKLAESALAQYRAERLGEKVDKLVQIESTNWNDYYEVVSDD